MTSSYFRWQCHRPTEAPAENFQYHVSKGSWSLWAYTTDGRASEDPNSLSLEQVALRVQGSVPWSWGAEQNIQQVKAGHSTLHTSLPPQKWYWFLFAFFKKKTCCSNQLNRRGFLMQQNTAFQRGTTTTTKKRLSFQILLRRKYWYALSLLIISIIVHHNYLCWKSLFQFQHFCN